MKRHELTIAIIIFLFLPLIGRGVPGAATSTAAMAIELTVLFFRQLLVASWCFRITDADGNPLDGAAVTAKGI